jgi:hypothetical protein
MQNSNPLASHFRQPSVFLKLPSGGKYWVPNSLNLSSTGEIGVMPMTAKDEILLRTPDALMNGQGVVSVIQSCCPDILNAWCAPTIDMDAILIAIRIATYGDGMKIDSKCTHCSHENRHEIGLGNALHRLKSPNYNKTFTINGLTFKFKPQNYMQANKNSLISFEEQKLISVVADENLDAETRKATFQVHLQNIINGANNVIAQCTESITLEDGTIVTNVDFIKEFYDNANNVIIKQAQQYIADFADEIKLPPAQVQCESCEKQYNVGVEFDWANFFDPLS